MATKKTISDEPFGRADPEQQAVATPVQQMPVEVVVHTEPPKGVEDYSRKGKVDEKFLDLISYLTALRDSYHDGEIQANFNQAITTARTAHLWAIEALRRSF
jgi:hypothetical protein